MIGSRNALGFLGVPEIGNPTSLPAAAPGFVGERPNGKIARPGMGGIFDRIGDKLKEPGMSGALLASAGATFNGGIGAGIAAGSDYMDRRHRSEAAAAQQEIENAFTNMRLGQGQQALDNGLDVNLADLGLRAGALDETGRHNRASEGIDANGQRIQLHGINTGAATTQRGQDIGFIANQQDNAQADRNSRRSFDASIYNDNVRLATPPAGIGGKHAYGQVQTKKNIPASPASHTGGFLGFGGKDVPAVPATEITTTMPVPLAGPTASPPPAATLRPGMIVDGLTYLGGNPSSAASWR